MPVNIAGIAENAANDVIGTAMGLALEGHNDRRQLKQQGKLQNLQIQGQKEMTDYNMMKQLEMWKATSYGAQKEQMKLAGINPALLYGMSGGGGATTGSANGNVSGAEAPKGGGEAMGMGIQMMNMQLMKAQKENIEAQTEKTKAETGKTGAETQSITEGIQNLKLQQKLLQIQSRSEQLEYDFSQATFADRQDAIHQDARRLTGEASQALIQANLDEAARQTRLNIIKQEYVEKMLTNALLTTQNNAIKTNIKLTEEEIRKVKTETQGLANEIMRQPEKWSNENQMIQLLREKNISADDEILKTVAEGIKDIITIRTLGKK